jgi:hypothetical protein
MQPATPGRACSDGLVSGSPRELVNRMYTRVVSTDPSATA